jgi:hypothetical protein
MRPEKLYLVDIVEAAEAIQRFCYAKNEKDFLSVIKKQVSQILTDEYLGDE